MNDNWCVTETPDDPSLNCLWVGRATDALNALDQAMEQEEFAPYSELVDPRNGYEDEAKGWVFQTYLGVVGAVFTNTTIWALPINHKEDPMSVAMTTRHQLDTVAKIEASLKEWEEGRMTSPDDRDHVIAACEAVGIDWHLIDRDTDNPVVEKIANEIYEDAGETITDIPDLATFILRRLFEEGVVPKTEASQKRTILVHLNVEVEDFDIRNAEQIGDYLLSCIEVGGEGNEKSEGLGEIVVAMAEEI